MLPVVREAEQKLAADNSLNHEYLPVLGFEPFCNAAMELLLGADHAAIKEGKAFGIQMLSGTGGLRVGAEFLNRICGYKAMAASAPTWGMSVRMNFGLDKRHVHPLREINS